jgi:hypothetical protein
MNNWEIFWALFSEIWYNWWIIRAEYVNIYQNKDQISLRYKWSNQLITYLGFLYNEWMVSLNLQSLKGNEFVISYSSLMKSFGQNFKQSFFTISLNRFLKNDFKTSKKLVYFVGNHHILTYMDFSIEILLNACMKWLLIQNWNPLLFSNQNQIYVNKSYFHKVLKSSLSKISRIAQTLLV